MQTSICQKQPIFRIPYFRPSKCRPLESAPPSPPPLFAATACFCCYRLTVLNLPRSLPAILIATNDIVCKICISIIIVNFQTVTLYLTYKGRYVCLFVCLSVCGRWPAERLGRSRPNLAGTHVDPGSVLVKVKVKVKVIWRHLANANKTPDRGAQAPREFEREAR